MIYLGNKAVKNVFLGDRPVARIYKGSDLVWERVSTEYGWLYFDIDPSATLISQAGTHAPGYWPDGTIISVKNSDDDYFAIYMSNRFVIRLTGSTPYPEDKMDQLTTANRVFGEGITTPITGFTDDGVWFIGIHRTGGNNLIGFLHAESGYPGPQFDAYRNIGVTYSTDNGLTWSAPQKIIAPTYTKPVTPSHSGVGDGCVIYDPVSERFYCYYMAHENELMCMAASATGASGDWYKWDGSDFTVEAYNSVTGVGGLDTVIPGFETFAGRNPQVMFNETIGKWVMVAGGWDGIVYMSSSDDAVVWETPIRITRDQNGQALYPSLVGPKGSLVGNTEMKLYHGRDTDPVTIERSFVYRPIQYTPVAPYALPTPETPQTSYEVNVGGSLYIPLENVPDYVVEAEWRSGSEGGFLLTRGFDFKITPDMTGSPASVPIYIRYNHRGYSSDWHVLPVSVVEPVPGDYDPSFQAVIDEALSLSYAIPGEDELWYINIAVEAIKAAGIWAKADRLFIFATGATNDALFKAIDYIDPSRKGTPYSLTVDRRGFIGAGTGSYFDTEYNANTQGVNYEVNNAARASYCFKEFDDTAVTPTHAVLDSANANTNMIDMVNSGSHRINSGTLGLGAGTFDMGGVGYKAINRNGANDVYLFNGKTRHDTVRASAGITNANQFVLRRGSNYGTAGLSFYYIGAALTEQQNNDLDDIISGLVSAVS